MLVIISPSKTLDFAPQAKIKSPAAPEFAKDATKLIHRLQKLSKNKVATLMGVSEKLAVENYDRFQSWQTEHTRENSKPAVLAYRGDVYDGLNAVDWKASDLRFAQQHLRILSGLYGVLRPTDLIQPYRLEMGTPLKVGRKKDLYAYWRETVTDAINAALAEAKTSTLVNLASKEYFSAIDRKRLEAKIITPSFKECRDGKYKFLSFFGKKARGAMAGYIVKQQLTDVEQIKNFDIDGYAFNQQLSSDADWIFTR